MIRILIVDDEKPICDLIDLNLSAAGYHCTAVQDGIAALEKIENGRYDLILLDVMLPGVDGYDIMEYIRPLKIPVIFITARYEVKDRVRGLKLGADDYLVKPFDVVELVARVEAVLRRYHKAENILSAFDVAVDVEARQVTRAGVAVELTNKEFGLLLLFIRNKNVALFRETLYENVWEGEYSGDSRTVDLHVQRLRKKLGWEQCLVTVYRVGRETGQAMDESRILRFAFETAALNAPARYDVLADRTIEEIGRNLENGGSRLLRISDEDRQVIYKSSGFEGDDLLRNQTEDGVNTWQVVRQGEHYYVQTCRMANAMDRALYLETMRDVTGVFRERALGFLVYRRVTVHVHYARYFFLADPADPAFDPGDPADGRGRV